MKRNVWIMTLLFLMSSFLMKLVAQENLDALVKKCETMTSVEMNYVYKKNSQTQKFEPAVITITISKDKDSTLIDEFLAALKKDEENATQLIESKQGGQKTSVFCKFKNASYSFSFTSEDRSASISVIYN